jgi:hypothetical protein
MGVTRCLVLVNATRNTAQEALVYAESTGTSDSERSHVGNNYGFPSSKNREKEKKYSEQSPVINNNRAEISF